MSDPSAGPAGSAGLRRTQVGRGRRTRAATEGEPPKAPESERPAAKKLRADECTALKKRNEELRNALEESDAAWRGEKAVILGDLEVATALTESNEKEIAKLRAALEAAKARLAKAEGRCALEWPTPGQPEALRAAAYSGVAAVLRERFECVVTGGLSPWCTRNANVCPECSRQSLLHTGTTFQPETYQQLEAFGKIINFRANSGNTFGVKCPYCNHAHDYDRSIGPGSNGVEPAHMTPRMKKLEELLNPVGGDPVLRRCVAEAFDDPDALKEYDAYMDAIGDWGAAVEKLKTLAEAERAGVSGGPHAEADGFAAACTLLRLVVEYHASGDFNVLLFDPAVPGLLDYLVGPFASQSVRCSIAIAMLAM